MKHTILKIIFTIISSIILLYSVSKSKNTSSPLYETQHQIEYKTEMENLFPNGTINGEGWSRKAIWRYKRKYIKSYSLFIKEWDYYSNFIPELKIWICLTISDLGYAGMYSLSVIDLNINKFNQIEEIIPFTFGKINLSENSLDDHFINFKGKKINISYEKKSNKRIIKAKSDNFILPNGKKGIEIQFINFQNKNHESINIQTTWSHNRNLFYLNEKLNGLESKTNLKIENKEINIKNISFTTLDWGRGVWSYYDTWFWSSGTGIINNNKIGFNFGFGFSDRSSATENCIFYNDIIHKVDIVYFDIPNNIMDKWIIRSNDNKVFLYFYPKVDRISRMNFLIIKSIQDQVFGIFEGKFVLDNGFVVHVKELYGFAEKVYNRW